MIFPISLRTCVRALLAVGVLGIATLSCGGDFDTEPLVQAKFRERVAAHRANLLRDCREEVREIASARADSILLDRAKRMRRIEGRPPRPARPGQPAVRELSAPLPLRPLFPFEIRFDTLLRDSLLQDSLRQDSMLRDSLGIPFGQPFG